MSNVLPIRNRQAAAATSLKVVFNWFGEKQMIKDKDMPIKYQNNDIGYIVVSEQANDIITAVKERKAFIVRTMIAVAIVILIFSLLN